MESVGGEKFTGGEHVGDDVFAEVVGGAGVGLVVDEVLPQLGPGEDIDAHGGQVALGVGGFLLELVDTVVLVHVHDAEAGGLLHGDLQHGDGAGRPRFLVQVDHVGVVHLVDMVAGQDDHIFRVIQVQKADVLIDGVGGALVPGALVPLTHVGGEDMYAAVGPVQVPGLAVAQVAVQLQGPVLGEDTYGVDAGIDAVGEREINDAVFAAEGDGGLCHVAGEGVETAALSSGQQHGYNFFFHTVTSYEYWVDIMQRRR